MTSSFDTTIAAITFFVIVVAAASNAILIVGMIVKRKVNKRPFDMFLFSMAFSDVCFVLSTGLPFAVYKANGTWTMGVSVCQVFLVGRAAFEKISLYTIGFVGIESFRALKGVGEKAFGMETSRVLIIGTWVTLVALACPYASWYILTTSPDGSVTCNVTFLDRTTRSYTVFNRALMFIPLILVVICYAGVIYRTIMSHRQVAKISRNGAGEVQRQKKTVRLATTCILIAVLYLICKLPFTIVLLYAQITYDQSLLRVAEVLWIISTANSATTPFVYRQLQISKGLLGLRKYCCCRNNTIAPIRPHITRQAGRAQPRQATQPVSGQSNSKY